MATRKKKPAKKKSAKKKPAKKPARKKASIAGRQLRPHVDPLANRVLEPQTDVRPAVGVATRASHERAMKWMDNRPSEPDPQAIAELNDFEDTHKMAIPRRRSGLAAFRGARA